MTGQHGDGTWAFNDYTRLHRAIVGEVDGIAACMGVDDSLFSYTLERGERCANGAVIFEVEVANG